MEELRPERFLILRTEDNTNVQMGVLSRKLNEEEIRIYQYPECKLHKSCTLYRDKNGIPDIFCLKCLQYKLNHRNAKATVIP